MSEWPGLAGPARFVWPDRCMGQHCVQYASVLFRAPGPSAPYDRL